MIKMRWIQGVAICVMGMSLSSIAWAQKGDLGAGPERPEIVIGLEEGKAKASYVAKMVQGIGVIRRKEREGVPAFRIQFKSRALYQKHLARLQKADGVRFLVEANPVFGKNPDLPSSLTYLDREIAVRSALHKFRDRDEEERGAAEGPGAEEDGEGSGLDYLQGLRAWLAVRAFPNKTIDWTGYSRALNQIKSMPATDRFISRSIQDPRNLAGWEFMGPTNLDTPYRIYFGLPPVSGRVNAVEYDPSTPGTFYCGLAQGGIRKTTDSGVTWTVMGDDWDINHVSSIAVDPKNPNTIYVGTGDFPGSTFYGIGIMKSIDGGNTWVNLGRTTFNNTAISKVLVDPDDSNIVTVSTGRGANYFGRVYRSTDGGQNWTIALNVSAPWSDIAIGEPRANNAPRYYFASGGGNGGNVYRSIDKGVTWTKLTVPLSSGFHEVLDMAPSKVNPEVAYLLAGTDRRILRTADGGNTWTDTTNNFPGGFNWNQQSYNYHIETSRRAGTNGQVDVIYVGQIDLVQSADGGATWQSIANGYTNNAIVHVDHHCLAVSPHNPNEIIAGSDGGIFRFLYIPGGTSTWTSLNRDLGATQFYHGAWHPTDPTKMLGGTQDNSTPVSRGDIYNWDNVGGGDGFHSAINQINPAFQYTTSQFGTVYRTTTAWSNQQQISPNTGSDNVPFHTRIYLDPNNGTNLYYMSNYLWRKQEPSGAWEPRLGGVELSDGQFILCVAVAPGDSNRIYTGSDSSDIFYSSDFGATWTRIDQGVPNRAVTGISVNPNNKNDITVVVSGFGTPKVWRCSDVTANPRTWVNVSGSGATGFPDLPANCITRDPTAPETTWYVGTDIGVYKTDDAGATWTNSTAALGLPNVEVTNIEANSSTRFLNVSTYGRGMWRIPISQLIPPRGTLDLDPASVLGGFPATGTVTLENPAGPGGVEVALFSSNTLFATVPSSVTVQAGETTGTFVVTTKQVVNAMTVFITATGETIAQTKPLQLTPISPASLDLDLPDVLGGTLVTGTVTLSAPAPTGGAAVTLASSVPNIARLQRNWVLVPAGQTSTTFAIQTIPTLVPVASIISAERGGIKATATLNIRRPSVTTLTTPANSMGVNRTLVATVTIDGNAPAGGFPVALQSSDTRVARVPASVTIPAGRRTATFIITSQNPAKTSNVTITARFSTQGQTKVITVTK